MNFSKREWKSVLRWLYPGMRVKRWLIIAIVGVLLISLGLSLILSVPYLRIIYYSWRTLVYELIRSYWLGVCFGLLWIVGGIVLVVYGLQKMNRSIISAIKPISREEVAQTVFRRRQLEKGPNIVAIGGGHGLHTLLHGIKEYTSNVTAVVTVFDDGGSSGKLRQEMGLLPPGDIRNCLVALADCEPLMRELFNHRFSQSHSLDGHNFGNLFIAALTQITGDFQKAILESSRVLAVRGKVLPTTLESVVLKAECDDGEVITGESNIGKCGKKIRRLFLDPQDVRSTPEVVEAIAKADMIVLGPGSLYTSVLCNLAIREVREAILRSSAPLVFVCNVTTQPGETDGFALSDHLKALFQFIPLSRVNYVLVNEEIPPAEELERVLAQGVSPVSIDLDGLPPGLKVVKSRLLSAEFPTRHDSEKLARALAQILVEEQPNWSLYFALYTREGLKSLKVSRVVSDFRARRKRMVSWSK